MNTTMPKALAKKKQQKPMSLAKQKSLYLQARQVYYTDPDGKTIMSDSEFDRLEASIKAQEPDWHVLHTTGHIKKVDTELPQYMPSLNKIYEWSGTQSNKGHIITPKLDGTALLLCYDNGVPSALFTRGNGEIGGDVSYLLPLLNIPAKINTNKPMYFRCEGIIKRSKFNKWKKTEANPNGFQTARAAVNGQFNRTLSEINPELVADIDIVVVAVYGAKAANMLAYAKQEGFTTVPTIPHKHINQDELCKLLEKAKKGPYDVDGLVLTIGNVVFGYKENTFPAFSYAFKQNDQGYTAIVREVQWQISRFGRWTPVIITDPVDFDGVIVQKATAHNVKLMYQRGIGVGAVIQLERAGDVIPFIKKVIKRAPVQSTPPGETYWKGTHLYAANIDNDAKILSMLNFIKGIGIEQLAQKSVAALYENGYTVSKLLSNPTKQLLELQRILGPALGKNLVQQLTTIKKNGITLEVIAAYSGVMPEGVGIRIMHHISKHIPTVQLLEAPPKQLFAKLQQIPNIGETRARQIAQGCRELRILCKKLQYINVPVIVMDTVRKSTQELSQAGISKVSNKYENMVAVWTGYRSKEQEALFIANGGTIGSSINGKTTHLFYNPQGKFMAKVENARERGIHVTTWEDFYGK